MPSLKQSSACVTHWHAPSSNPTLSTDEWGGTTLIADLGCFTLESNPELLASLNPEEAALYECFSVSRSST